MKKLEWTKDTPTEKGFHLYRTEDGEVTCHDLYPVQDYAFEPCHLVTDGMACVNQMPGEWLGPFTADDVLEIGKLSKFKANKSQCGRICNNSAGRCPSCVDGSEFVGPWD